MLNFKNRTKRGRSLTMTIDSETKSGPIAVVGTIKKRASNLNHQSG